MKMILLQYVPKCRTGLPLSSVDHYSTTDAFDSRIEKRYGDYVVVSVWYR